ncbi:nitronate monooxygenase [Niabella terrae]
MQTPVTRLFQIRYPLIQAGMVWASGWRLAAAVSSAGGLGVIGAGSMSPDVLRTHIQKCQAATKQPFAVNLPLLYHGVDQQVAVILEEKVPIVFTSAGNPATWTPQLKAAGIIVVHVVSSSKFAQKAEVAGCDGIVAEGFEAGGHNGREETTTMVLVPLVRAAVKIPVIAAGGIATGAQMLAALSLGADGVQMGSRFVASEEASSHLNFKLQVIQAAEGSTRLAMKQLTPVRLLENDFSRAVFQAELEGADREALQALLGKGRARRGMFEGDIAAGELEIGQVSALLDDMPPAAVIVQRVMQEFDIARQAICRF